MALYRSKSSEFLPYKTVPSATRQLQEALYALLDDLEKSAFIETLSSYGAHRDVFELVSGLRKILNTPVKRQLFPLVRRVIRHVDIAAFDLVTRDVGQNVSLTLPYLYGPHMADLNVLNKYQASTALANHRTTLTRSWVETTAANHGNLSGRVINPTGTLQKVGGVSGQDIIYKIQSKRVTGSKHELDGEIVEIDIGEPAPSGQGFGFSIRGGLESGVGVYVSIVDKDSVARSKGLAVGDHILEANNISFRDISHEEAARIITAASRLRLAVSRAGRIPGSHTVHEAYSWTDPRGRPVSPPLEWAGGAPGDDDLRRRSGTLMLKGSDERKINLMVHKGQGLGVMIRGGSEYGLGIFVSGIDPFSVADNAGLKLGDQILDVNGHSFLDVTHLEAVNHLKKSRHLIMTVKDVGKIPLAKTTIDERGWIESTRVGSYPHSLSLSSRKSVTGSATDQEMKKKSFLRGVGTQLMLSSSLGKAKQREQIHNQAKLFLNETEHATLNYYLAEYEKKVINIRGLVHALLELFNTPAKFTMLSEIRATVLPADVEMFDKLVVRRELEKSLNQARQLLAPDVMSLNSFDSDDVMDMDKHKRTMFSQASIEARTAQTMEEQAFEGDQDTSYRLLETSRRLSQSTPDLSNYDDGRRFKRQFRSRSRSPRSAFRVISAPEAIRRDPRTRLKRDDPSDDSGVEVNGHALKGAVNHVQFEQGFLHTLHQTQKTNLRKLSDPQKKILSNLQHRSQTAGRLSGANSVGHIVRPYTNQNSVRNHSEVPLSRPSAHEKIGSYNLSAYPRSEEQDQNIDVHALEPEMEHPSNNPRIYQSPNMSRKLRVKVGDKEMSSARSKLKSENTGEFPNSNEGERDNNDVLLSKSCVVQENQKFSRKDIVPGPNQDNIYIFDKQTQKSVNTPDVEHFSRNDKSPLKKIWNYRRGTPSTATTLRTKLGSTLTVNSSNESSTLVNGGEIYSINTPLSVLTAQKYKQKQEDRKHDQSIITESHSHVSEKDNISSDTMLDKNGVASKQEYANKQSKRVFFTNARKGGVSNDSPPSKVGGVISSRYKSPRRDKKVSKINVPLIRKDMNFLDDDESSSLVNGWNNDVVTERNHYLTVSYSDNPLLKDQDSLPRRMTATDQIKGDPNVHNDGLYDDVNRRHVTNISVGGGQPGYKQSDLSERPEAKYAFPASKMDGCLGQISFRLPRPEVYTPVELAIMDDMNKVEAIKKKATETYGQIPLDVVYIYRSKPTLGVAIEGGANTRQPLPKVISVQPGGSAFESGGLRVGHVILEVNGQPAVGLSHMDAARLIAEAFKNMNYDRMELLVTDWSDKLLDTIKVDIGLLKVK